MRCVDRESFAAALAPAGFDPATLVVVAGVKPIEREWRLVVTGDEVIAASQYSVAGTRSVAPGCPDKVRKFVAGMLADVTWRPDPIFLMDVCVSGGQLRLVELGGVPSLLQGE